ncbi:MAG: hypothetical protein Q8O92_05075 [Candidatus Latescibacter sp.]|nr:hypothetical protein [Candidatus Latescibacter sp.]
MRGPLFSERELGPQPRKIIEIPEIVWKGIVSIINRYCDNGYFAEYFPLKQCNGSRAEITGTNKEVLTYDLLSINPNIESIELDHPHVPDSYSILDLIEYCLTIISKPFYESEHEKYGPKHYIHFSKQAGIQEYTDSINFLFSRNRVAFCLNNDGKIERIEKPVIGETIKNAQFNTIDSELNELLERAREKFFNPNPVIRKESLEKLWDAWERIKSLENPSNKSDSTKRILDMTASGPFRELIENEALCLNKIGNNFIRLSI